MRKATHRNDGVVVGESHRGVGGDHERGGDPLCPQGIQSRCHIPAQGKS